MRIFKSLLASHNLLQRSSPPSRQPSRWLSIRKALLPRAAVATDSIAAALASLSSKRKNQYALAAEEERTLPPDHPHTVRVRRIAAKLIAEACEDRNYGRLRLLPERIIRRPFDDIDCNVGVLDEDCMNAYSNYKGMIRISTGLLEYLQNDAQVATVLGHEVGHVIARHIEKSCRNWLQVRFLVHFLGELLHVDPGPSDKVMRNEWSFLFMRPCYFRHEFEADRIGLLLIAAAGYDPRVGPALYADFANIERRSRVDHTPSTHPPSFERAQVLTQAKVMDQALDLYRQAVIRSGKDTETKVQGRSWASSFKLGLAWRQFRTDNLLKGVCTNLILPQSLWNNSGIVLPPFLWNRARNSVRNSHAVSQWSANNRRPIQNAFASSSVQQAIYQYNTGHTPSWQLQKNDVHSVISWRWTMTGAYLANSAYKMFFNENVSFPCAKPL